MRAGGGPDPATASHDVLELPQRGGRDEHAARMQAVDAGRGSPALIAAIAVLALGGTFVHAQNPMLLRWDKAAPFPEPEEELYGVEAGGKMYVIGGFSENGKPAPAMVYEYDPAGDRWTKKKPIPLPVHHQAQTRVQRQDLRVRRMPAAAHRAGHGRVGAGGQLVGIHARHRHVARPRADADASAARPSPKKWAGRST